MQLESILIVLFIIATTVAVLARRLRVPYTIALVLTGLGLGMLRAFEPPHLTKDLLFTVFLPGLIFEAAFHLELTAFRQNAVVIFALALPGVVASILLTALILLPASSLLHLSESLTWNHALLFGALIAATDPIAVVGLFRNLGVPRRLATLIEGESLLNDGTSIVIFALVLGLVLGTPATASGMVLGFAQVVGIGVAVGFLSGVTLSAVTKRIDDPMIEITLTTIAAYGSFVLAEQAHGSGVIATVVAGMLCGNYGARTGMSASTRVAVETFWEYVAFALNSIVFLLIGFEVRVTELLASWQVILSAFLAVVVGRAVVVYSASGLLARTTQRLPASWSAVLTWGGLRGSLSMVLALSLPSEIPNRELLVATTFGVVILSIIVQGLSMAPLLRSLGLAQPKGEQVAYQQARGGIRAAQAALGELDRMARSGGLDQEVLATLRRDYEDRVATDRGQLRDLHVKQAELREDELRSARRRLLLVEKEEVIDAEHDGTLGRDAYERLLADVDGRLLRLDSNEPEPAPPRASGAVGK